MSHVLKKPHTDIILSPLKDQLLKKNKKTPENNKNKTDFVSDDNRNEVVVNPKSSLATDAAADWTQLLNGNERDGGLPRASRQVRSGSNLLALDAKQRSQARRRSDVEKVNNQRLDGNRGFESKARQAVAVAAADEENLSSEMDAAVTNANDEKLKNLNDGNSSDLNLDLVKNEQIISNSSSGVAMTGSSNKTEESLSASDDGTGTDSDSDSSSDSESEREREREERRKRREQLLAQKAAAKAVEAIKDRENLVARLEGEKQSLEKIIDERAKQQAHEVISYFLFRIRNFVLTCFGNVQELGKQCLFQYATNFKSKNVSL